MVGTISVGQQTALIAFLEAHPALALARCSRNKEGRSVSRRLWVQVADTLNSFSAHCAKKSADQWRMYFNEYKSKLLKKIRIERSATGSRQAEMPSLTPLQGRLYTILGQDVTTNKQLYWMKNLEYEPSAFDVNDPLPTEDTLDSDYTDSRDNGTVEDRRDVDSYDDNILSPGIDNKCSGIAKTKVKPAPEKDHDYCEDIIMLKKRNYPDFTEYLPEKKRKYLGGDEDKKDKNRKRFDSLEDTTDKKREYHDCVEDTTDKKRKYHDCVEDTMDKKRKYHDCVEDTTDKKRQCRDCVENTTDEKRECRDCVEGNKRNDYFGGLIVEEIKLVPPCMRNTVFRHCLKLVDAFKKKHRNEDEVEVIFPQ